MAGLVLTAMVILGRAGSAPLAPLSSNPRSHLRPPRRADGLPTSVYLQIHLAAATLVAALLVALDLAAATQPAWRLPDATAVHDLIPPAYAVLAATLALTVGVETMRVRGRLAIVGRPKPVGQAFALAFWRWAFMGWSGLLLGLARWANGRWHTLDPAALIVVALVLLIGVPAVGVVTARLLESWTGDAVLRRGPRPTRRLA